MFVENPIRPGSSFRLNLQMVTDYLDERDWPYTVHRSGEKYDFVRCQLYYGQSSLSTDTLYIFPEGEESDFPADRFSYITTGSLRGNAPHIRNVKCSFPELLNYVIYIFDLYSAFEKELCNTISGGGSLSDVCEVASKYLNNPVYVHDNLFCVIGCSSTLEPKTEFEFSDKTRKLHIPLWLINELKFDNSFKDSLFRHSAGIWGNDRYYSDVRSLYVNLWDGSEYLGRLMINESKSSIKPGQFRTAEYVAGYLILWLKNQILTSQHINNNFEQTFIDLIDGETDDRSLKTVMSVLGWQYEDKYICLKIQNQNNSETVSSDLAINSRLSSLLSGYISFRYQQKLCVIIDLSVSGLDLGDLRLRLAPLIRDSCLYVGISNPVDGIYSIKRGFVQSDISLRYITDVDSSDWMVLFSSCALNYIRESACEKLPAMMVAHPILLDLIEHDRAQGTQYYDTLRAYLLCERNIPATAAALIIHRTTLTYRLGKISELTRLNLDDPNLRLYLLISFQMLEQGSGFISRQN